MESAQNIIQNLTQVLQNAQEEKRLSIGVQSKPVSQKKASQALKKMQKSYALAFGLQENEDEFAQPSALSEEGQIDSSNQKQKLAMEMLKKEQEKRQA